jgi:replicative DNA helicase
MSRRPLYDDKEPDELVVHFDLINEQSVLGAALRCDDRRAKLVRQVQADQFHSDKHVAGWAVVVRMAEQGLEYDPRTLATLVDAELCEYLVGLAEQSSGRNLDQHVERLRWDAARMRAAKGPVPRLLAALKNTRAEPTSLTEAAREVGACFDGYGDTSAMPAPGDTADEQSVEIRMRMVGKASYPCGIPDLDYRDDGAPRLVPGFAPKRCTWITGVSGSGKSTLAAMIAHGLWRNGRKVLYGGWEPGNGNVLELMACWEAGISREALKLGEASLQNGTLTDDDIRRHADAMHEIEKGIRLLKNPFRQGRVEEEQGKRGFGRADTNERRVDVLARYIERSGCEVFVADLMKRAFARTRDPSEEEQCLYMVQDMKDQLGIHLIGLHQQLIKGASVQGKTDRRPSTEGGLMGSSAWFQTGDLILGVYRDHLYHNVEDNQLEVHVMKQRDGRWPIAICFDYDAPRALLGSGKEFDYRPMEGAGDLGDGLDAAFKDPKPRGGRKPARPHLQSVKDHDDEPFS